MDEVAHLIREAVKHLEAARAEKGKPSPDYHRLLGQSLAAMRSAWRALLTYHDVPHEASAPLARLGEQADELASILRLWVDLVPGLEDHFKALAGKETLTVADREQALQGYYVARDAVHTTLGELPPALVAAATGTDGQATPAEATAAVA